MIINYYYTILQLDNYIYKITTTSVQIYIVLYEMCIYTSTRVYYYITLLALLVH